MVKKLKCVKKRLIEWSKVYFHNNAKRIEETMKKIEELQNMVPIEDIIRHIKEYEAQLEEWGKKEEMLWYQRSKVIWLHCGDKNTKFFHQKTLQRR